MRATNPPANTTYAGSYTAMSQCKLLPVVSLLAALLVVVHLGSWLSGTPEAERATPIRAKHLDLPPEQTELTALPTLGSSNQEKQSDEAYVALQYGGFFLGLRVLGQSLRESNTDRDMVALCMPDVPEHHRKILRREGWIIRSVDALPKSCIGDHLYSLHFTKVLAWLLTEYRRIVLLDSDAIVLRNVDELFSCGEFCAAYRNSDLFNTGVVVLKPSEETFRNICSKIQSTPSYTNGDQGFLNYFYEDMKTASMFSPSAHRKQVGFANAEKLQRLPSEYNGDVGVFYVMNQWMYLDTEEPYILHYTLGPVKPWKWWSYPLFPLNWKWKSLRDRLPPVRLPEPSLWDCSSWFPMALLLALGLSSKIWVQHLTRYITSFSWVINPLGHYTWMAVSTLLFTSAFSLAFLCVPETMNPTEAWVRYGLWTLLLFSFPFSLYCHLAYVVGTQSAGITDLPPKNTPVVRSWRIASEVLLWLLASGTIFYLQFWVPVVQTVMMKRIVTFFGLWFLNFAVCYVCGRRVLRHCHSLGYHSGL